MLSLLLLISIAACAPEPDVEPEVVDISVDLRRAFDYVPVDPATLPPPRRFDSGSARPSLQVYLHRGGGTYYAGTDNPVTNRTLIITGAAKTLPAYAGTDAEWDEIVGCVQGLFSRFNIEISDEVPSDDYIEIALGGDPSDIGADPVAAGVAPIDLTTCRVLDTAVGFVFTEKIGASRTRAICESTAHEIAHPLSLDHAFLCEDPMSYLFECGDKSFQDVDADCGEHAARPCSCGRTTQNSVQVLHEKLGSPLIELADLVAASLEADSTRVAAGARLGVRYSRRNDGIVAAAGFADRYTLDGNQLGTYNRSTLPPGETRGPYRTTLLIPATTPPGVHQLRYEVDHRGDVDELDETNNHQQITIRVTAAQVGLPDLGATASLSVTSAAPGARVRVTYTRSNTGESTATGFEDGYYLSTNATITTIDTLLSSARRGGLAAGGTAGPYTRSVTLPADLAPGTYWIGYYVDHLRAIRETSETNNRAAVQVTVP